MPSATPGLDLHLVALRRALAAGAVAGRARVLDHGAVAAAARARLREREEALALGDDAAAVALRADPRRRPGLGARAAAGVAGGLGLDRHADSRAVESVLEGEPHLDLEVGAALGHRPRVRAAAAAAVEDPAEEVAEIAVEVGLEAAGRRAAGRPRRSASYCLRLLRVREQVVRGLHVLEALLGGCVARVAVRDGARGRACGRPS